jgi:hypothetical protein
MATQIQTAQELFSQGTRLTCFTNAMTLDLSADAVEHTTYCSSGLRDFRQGLKSWSLQASGFADYAASTAHSTAIPPGEEIAPTNQGSVRALTVCPVSGTEGTAAYLFGGYYSEMVPVGAAVGDMAPYSFSAMPTMKGFGHRMGRGILEANRTVTATGNTTGSEVIGAVASGSRLCATLHVFTLSGTSPSITAKIQVDDNSGFSSATDAITFTAATTRGGEYKDTAGPITDTWLRAQWTISGTSPSIAFAIAVGTY